MKLKKVIAAVTAAAVAVGSFTAYSIVSPKFSLSAEMSPEYGRIIVDTEEDSGIAFAFYDRAEDASGEPIEQIEDEPNKYAVDADTEILAVVTLPDTLEDGKKLSVFYGEETESFFENDKITFSFSFAMPKEGIVVSAEIKDLDTYNITAVTDGEGSVTINGQDASEGVQAAENSEVTVEAEPAEGYEVGTVMVITDRETFGIDSGDSFVMPSGDVEVQVAFTKKSEETNVTKNEYDDIVTRSRAFMTDSELEIYEKLKAEIQKITLGEITNTEIEFEISTPIEDGQEMGNTIINAAEYLMYDYPEYLYWCAGYGYSYYSATKVEVWFYVETEYSSGDFEVNTEKLELSNQSLKNAVEIAQKYTDKSDYDKIMGYAGEITKLNTYNWDAANIGSENSENQDPWDLIYIFDNDPDTNSVCAGYARAFEYLCHLGGIECYRVTGSMGGPHAWNVVVLDGVSYHADVTMADDDGSDSFNEYHQFVLTPAISSSKEKCEFDFKYGNHGFAGTYAYSEKTQGMYPEELLAVSTQPYSSKESDFDPEHNITITPTENGSVTVDNETAKKGDTVMLTASPDEGYALDSCSVIDNDENAVDTSIEENEITFTMPDSDVTVIVTFKKIEPEVTSSETEEPNPEVTSSDTNETDPEVTSSDTQEPAPEVTSSDTNEPDPEVTSSDIEKPNPDESENLTVEIDEENKITDDDVIEASGEIEPGKAVEIEDENSNASAAVKLPDKAESGLSFVITNKTDEIIESANKILAEAAKLSAEKASAIKFTIESILNNKSKGFAYELKFIDSSGNTVKVEGAFVKAALPVPQNLLPENTNTASFFVYHATANGFEKINSIFNAANNTVEFAATDFSPYLITLEELDETVLAPSESGSEEENPDQTSVTSKRPAFVPPTISVSSTETNSSTGSVTAAPIPTTSSLPTTVPPPAAASSAAAAETSASGSTNSSGKPDSENTSDTTARSTEKSSGMGIADTNAMTGLALELVPLLAVTAIGIIASKKRK